MYEFRKTIIEIPDINEEEKLETICACLKLIICLKVSKASLLSSKHVVKISLIINYDIQSTKRF